MPPLEKRVKDRQERKRFLAERAIYSHHEILKEIAEEYEREQRLELWKKAVKSLYKGKGYRFQRFILPAIGWAKYLGPAKPRPVEYFSIG